MHLCLFVILNDGPGTNAGQVSIALTPAPHLDGKYVVFAEVVSGFDVLLEINAMADPERLMKAGGGGGGGEGGGGGGGGGGSDGSGGGALLKEAMIQDSGVIDQLEEEHHS